MRSEDKHTDALAQYVHIWIPVYEYHVREGWSLVIIISTCQAEKGAN